MSIRSCYYSKDESPCGTCFLFPEQLPQFSLTCVSGPGQYSLGLLVPGM